MNFPMQRPKELEDWKSEVSPEVVERAKKALVDNYDKFVSTSNFIGVGKTENDVEVWKDRGCHASMSSVKESCREVLATENGRHRRKGVSSKLARPFLEWFLNDSPYGFIILNRDDVEFCDRYGFVLAGDAPTTLVQCACIISRHFYECYPRSFIEFNKLVERGVDGFIAYNICFNSSLSSFDKDRDLSTQTFYDYAGHRVAESLAPSYLLPYYQGEIKNPLGDTYKQAPTIYGSTRLFIDGYTYGGPHLLSKFRKNNKEFHNFLLEKEGKLDKSGIYRPPNPFVKQQTAASEFTFTCEQAVTVVADYLQQYVEEQLKNV